MRTALALGIAAVFFSAAGPASAAPACTAEGIFITGNAAQAWIWTLHDHGGTIAGALRYVANGRAADAHVAGKRTGSTLRLTLTDAAGRAHKALAGVTCSRPTPEIPVDEILFVRVTGPVPHLAFGHARAASESALLAQAHRVNARLPTAPPPGGLPGWLTAMDAVTR
jgi:hypothetical protein